jgi:hypothetical protein
MMKLLWKKAIPVFCLVLILAVGGLVGEADVSSPAVLAQGSLPDLTAIAYQGMNTPAAMGGVFEEYPEHEHCFEDAYINDAGDVVFWSTVYKDGNYTAGIFLYSGKTKEITKVVAWGDPAPYGGAFEDWGVYDARLTNYGVVWFVGEFHIPPSEDYPAGHLAYGIFWYQGGEIGTFCTTEDPVLTKGTWQGFFESFEDVDMNYYNDVVVSAEVVYRDGDGVPQETESGVYLHPQGGDWEKILTEGEAAPGGGDVGAEYVGQENRSLWISDGRYVARSCYIDGPPYGQTILLRPWGGAWSRTISTGDFLPDAGGSLNVEVDSFSAAGLNTHGQVAVVVRQPDVDPYYGAKHFYVYSDGEAHRVVGCGDAAPSPRDDLVFKTDWGELVASISDNRVPLDWPDPDFSAEAVFTSLITDGDYNPWYHDLYSYTADTIIRPVALGKEDAPDPPGGELFLTEQYHGGAPRSLDINNMSQILVNGFVLLAPSEQRNVMLLTSLDSDGDSLLDVWERDGIDADGDGTLDLLLPVMGATEDHKDIFVEIDYMAGHHPNDAAINDVIDAFWDAPVENPDGDEGIRLHVLIDDEIPHTQFLKMFDDFDLEKDFYFGTSVDRALANKDNILKAKSFVYHYCIFADQYQTWDTDHGTWEETTSSGLSELPGNDFLVSLGAFTGGVGSQDEQAGTFMHELGHNLGLRHGGGDDINCKPNYLSIMSYSRQLKALIDDRPLDYSREELEALDESDLDEGTGVGGLPGERTVFFTDTNADTYNDKAVVVDAYGAVDWNQQGTSSETGVSVDLNSLIWEFDAHGDPVWRFDGNDKELQVLEGYDDWSNLVYNFRHAGGFAHGAHPDVADPDMTWELVQSLYELANDPPNMPADPSPADNATGVSMNADLSWSGGDPDAGNTVTYNVSFGMSSPPPFKESIGPYAANKTSLSYTLDTLASNTTYYWRIVAKDSYNATTEGPEWKLTTGLPLMSYNITLYTGWNLVSLPLIPDNTSIADVTAGINDTVAIIWGWDAEGQAWLWNVPDNALSTLTTMEPSSGYWFFMNSPATLEVFGQEMPDPPTLTPAYDVFEEWNLIGFTSTTSMSPESYLASIAGNYSIIWGWDAEGQAWLWYVPGNPASILTTMEPGDGYWLWGTAEGTIVPPT